MFVIHYEPVLCYEKHQSAFNISLNVNVVYQAIWMKCVFNLAALGLIQTGQTFIVSFKSQ